MRFLRISLVSVEACRMIENFKGRVMPEVLKTDDLDRSVGETAVLRVLQISC